MQINVQFFDSSNATVVSYFSGPQDEVEFPNQGQIDSGDARWKTYYNSLPSLSQRSLPTPA